MKLKTLFRRMKDDFEVKYKHNDLEVFSFDLKNRKKTRIDINKCVEFEKYINGLRKKKELITK